MFDFHPRRVAAGVDHADIDLVAVVIEDLGLFLWHTGQSTAGSPL